MERAIKILGMACLVLGLTFGCKDTQKKEGGQDPTAMAAQPKADTLVDFEVRRSNEWTDKFYRKKGWFGADGIFTMNLNGVEKIGTTQPNDSIFMFFSDTMTGTIEDNSVVDYVMLNNSIAGLRGISPDNLRIQYNTDTSGEPINYFDPSTPNSKKGDYYWTGDGFVNQEDGNSINIFGYRVINHSDASWDFEIVGVTIITLQPGDPAPFKNHSQIDAPLIMDIEGVGKGTFGSGVYVNTEKAGAPDPDGYLYIYGLLDPNKQLVVARVEPSDFKNFEAWRYWNGSSWDEDINMVKPITDRVSNELSLTPMKDGRYLLVFQEDGIGNHTAIRIGESPVGPFGPIQRIYLSPEGGTPPGIIPYNAKAHPALSTEDELLISYNTISLDYFEDIKTYPNLYRPRFIWLKINE